RKFFLQVSDKAALAAYPSLLLAEWMESYYRSLKEKRIIIPHQLMEVEATELPEFFDKNLFNIVHAGNLMIHRNPLSLLKAFELFLKENPGAKKNSRLFMIGNPSIYLDKYGEMI